MRALSLSCAALIGSLIFVAVGAHQSEAQFGRRITPTSRIVQMRGHWLGGPQPLTETGAAHADRVDEDSDEPPAVESESADRILGTLSLAMAADGTHVRRFAVTMVRAYHDADGGMEIFRKASLRPVVNVRGRDEMLVAINEVPVGESFSVYGQFATGSSELVVSSIELPEDQEEDDSE